MFLFDSGNIEIEVPLYSLVPIAPYPFLDCLHLVERNSPLVCLVFLRFVRHLLIEPDISVLATTAYRRDS